VQPQRFYLEQARADMRDQQIVIDLIIKVQPGSVDPFCVFQHRAIVVGRGHKGRRSRFPLLHRQRRGDHHF
jgi:hypothetical protein